MKVIKYFIVIFLISYAFEASSQSRTITGIVMDDNGPLVGASVSEKNNPQNSTATGAEGRFQLSLPATSNTLIISNVGYLSTEIDIAGKSDITIRLEIDSKGIDEVIVVGFGTQKRFTNTGAVSSVSRTEIVQTPSASLQNALTGKLPGFFTQQRSGMPGRDGAEFFVRGVSTFTGNQQPLILLDDIEYSYEQFANIDPNEIESISILKDAATTAVYGIKGANGVILVTTRRGKEGRARINFRTEYGIQTPTHVPQFLNAYETAMLHNEALRNDGVPEGSPDYFSDESLQHFLNGTDPYGHPDVDWYNTLFRSSAPMSTNNFDISGGTSNVQYMVSMGYLRQNGMLRQFNAHKDEIDNGYYYNRYSFRSNLDIKATNTLALRLDISGNFGERNNPYFHGQSGAGEIAVFSEVARFTFLNPYMYPVRNPDGSWGYGGPTNRGVPFNNSNNIVGRIAHGGYTRVRQNLLNFNLAGTQKLDILTEGLAARASISTTNTNASQRQIIRRDFPSFYYDPVADSYTPRDINVHRILPWESTYNGGSPNRQVNVQANLTYNRSFGDHNTSALLLFNQTSKIAPDNGDPLNHYIPDNFRGYTIRAGYDYQQKYLLEINAGYNGTDKFVSQNRYALFPAVSVGWNIAEERFFSENISFIELFKLRGSYGIVGSDDIGGYRYAYEEVYNRQSPFSFGESHNNFVGITEGFLGNDAIIWEKERKTNLGLDFSMFSGKLTGAVDVFDNYRSDILTIRNTTPLNFGVSRSNLPPVNIGKVSNKGYEVELRYRTRFNDFGLDIKGNYSFAKNKIIEMDEVEPKYPWQRATGLPLGMVRQWIFDGFYTQEDIDNPDVPKPIGTVRAGYLKYRDLNDDGVISADDKAYINNPNLQNTTIGLNLGLSYRGFSISALLQAAINFDVQIGQALSTPWSANLQPFHLERWTPETAETAKFPALTKNFLGSYMTSGEASTFWVVPGDYLRLRSLEVAYQLPGTWVKHLHLNNLRIYANGYNLLTWSETLKRFQYDPEVARSVSSAPYPQQAIFNFGINVSF